MPRKTPSFGLLAAALILCLALCPLCGCARAPRPTPTPPAYAADNPLVGAALDTVIRFNQARTEMEGETMAVPEEFWAPEIAALEPRGVYWHHNNLALLMDGSDAATDNLYIYVPISSYMPQEEITELQIGQQVYRFHVIH